MKSPIALGKVYFDAAVSLLSLFCIILREKYVRTHVVVGSLLICCNLFCAKCSLMTLLSKLEKKGFKIEENPDSPVVITTTIASKHHHLTLP